MPDDPVRPSRERRIAAAVEALRRDLDGLSAEDTSRDAELRRRLQELADLFLGEAKPGPPVDLDRTR